MRTLIKSCVFLFSCLIPAAFSASVEAKKSDVVAGIAQRMTQEAQDAGAAGYDDLRQSLLDQVTTIAPDHAPARWEQGQIEVDGEWRTIGELQAAAQTDEKLARYQKMKTESAGQVEDDWRLARWCRRNGLEDEAQYHWLKVLQASPEHRQALEALEVEWHEGELVSPEVASELRLEQRLTRKTDGKWRARISAWKRALADGGPVADAALADLQATVDESAVREFEKLADSAGQAKTAGDKMELRLASAFVDALADMPNYEATESLVRFSVLAPQESLRAAATEHLTQRPKHEFMPLLLSRLTSTIETRFDIRRSETGRVNYTHEFFAAGGEADQVREISLTGLVRVNPNGNSPGNGVGRLAAAERQAATVSDGQVRGFMSTAAELERQAAAANAQREAMNERVVAVLTRVTGKELGHDLQAWWNYWKMHNEYEVSTYRPTEVYRDAYQYEETVTAAPPPSTFTPSSSPPRSCECFVAGTLVWTKTGMRPIEEIREGDLVLSQDVETGENCFRPVLGTTLRAPTPIVSVRAGAYQIDATLGHPFWVAGEGWRMAKELQPGDRLRTIQGPVEIEQVEDVADAEAYNLVVWDTNNYFVGQQGVLVHDNTPRRPDRVRAGQQ